MQSGRNLYLAGDRQRLAALCSLAMRMMCDDHMLYECGTRLTWLDSIRWKQPLP